MRAAQLAAELDDRERDILIRNAATGVDRNPTSKKLPEVQSAADPLFAYYWRVWCILSRQRNWSIGFGAAVPQHLSIADIVAVARSMGEQDVPWFIDTITRMDAVHVDILSRRMSADSKK